MSSLTTCSGQGVLVQRKEKEKECVVENIRNRSSHCAAHLLPIFNNAPLPQTLNYSKMLDSFQGFYVNKYVNYHTYKTVV